jgi:hypothetical protein
VSLLELGTLTWIRHLVVRLDDLGGVLVLVGVRRLDLDFAPVPTLFVDHRPDRNSRDVRER